MTKRSPLCSYVSLILYFPSSISYLAPYLWNKNKHLPHLTIQTYHLICNLYILFLYLNELSLLFYIYIDQKGYYTKFLFETPFILKSFKILSSCISKATYSIIIIFLMDKLDSFSCFLFSWSITYAHACCSGKRIKFTWLNPIK